MKTTGIRVAWSVIAVALAIAAQSGGDTAIWSGWLFLVWTFPFSLLWWTFAHDIAREYVSAATSGVIGSGLAIAMAYLVWFVAAPWLFRRVRQRKGSTQMNSQAQ